MRVLSAASGMPAPANRPPAPPSAGGVASAEAAPALASAAGLTVSSPSEPAELEAEALAARVMAPPVGTTTPVRVGAADAGHVHRRCAECDEEHDRKDAAGPEGEIRRSADGAPRAAPKRLLDGGGQPLPAAEREFFEARFGHDFSRVRIHADEHAARSASELSASAFTLKNDIAFAHGRYQPGSDRGRHLLAHELAHVVQQGEAAPIAGAGRSPAPTSPGAPRIARQVDGGAPPTTAARAGAGASPPATMDRRPAEALNDPNFPLQAGCLAVRGACPQFPVSGGVVDRAEVEHRWNEECRSSTQYQGPDIWPTAEECKLATTGAPLSADQVAELQKLVNDVAAIATNGGLSREELDDAAHAIGIARIALERAGVSGEALTKAMASPAKPAGPSSVSRPDVLLAGGGALAARVATGASVTGGAAAAGASTATAAGTATTSTGVTLSVVGESAAAGAAGSASAGTAATVGTASAATVAGAVVIVAAAAAVVVGLSLLLRRYAQQNTVRVDPVTPRLFKEARDQLKRVRDRPADKAAPRVAPPPGKSSQPQPDPDVDIDEVPEETERDCDKQAKEPCVPAPIIRKGGNSKFTRRHNRCADKVTLPRFVKRDICIDGKAFDALDGDNVLWEIKGHAFSFARFYKDPRNAARVVEEIIDEAREERRKARKCGYGFKIGVRDKGLKEAIERVSDFLVELIRC
jgi:hypothetical protein